MPSASCSRTVRDGRMFDPCGPGYQSSLRRFRRRSSDDHQHMGPMELPRPAREPSGRGPHRCGPHGLRQRPDLSTLTPCSTGGGPGTSEQFPLDQGSVDQLGLDDSYVGALVTVTETWSETVWINRVQLSKR